MPTTFCTAGKWLAALGWLPLCLWSCGAAAHQGWSSIPLATERIALPTLRGEARFFDVEDLARRGTHRVVAFILDANVTIAPYHFSEVGLDKPASIDSWGSHLGHALLINAGLFDSNSRPLGLAKRDNAWLSTTRHKSWQGMLVGQPPSHLVDLRFEADFDAAAAQHVWQSMMLVDRHSELRVRTSNLSACRTVVGEDAGGHIVIVLTQGAVTLAALGQWLVDGPLRLTQALNLDGGHESQALLRTPELELTLLGRHGVHLSGEAGQPLPAVLAITPARKEF